MKFSLKAGMNPRHCLEAVHAQYIIYRLIELCPEGIRAHTPPLPSHYSNVFVLFDASVLRAYQLLGCGVCQITFICMTVYSWAMRVVVLFVDTYCFKCRV